MTKKAQAKFDKWAATYDESPHQSTFFEPLHDLTLHEAGIERPRAGSILDIGCGTGVFLRRAAMSFPEAKLTGVDASAEMIKAALASAPAGVDVTLRVGSAEALPLPDSSFDLVVTTSSFHHWTDQKQGLAEVHRVLRPGGVFVLSDILAAGFLGFPGLGWLFGRVDGGRFNSPATLDRMLEAVGLATVRRVDAPHLAHAAKVTIARRDQ